MEHETIYPIPADQRHGSAGYLFTLWFSANAKVLTIVTGSLVTVMFHLAFLPAAIAIVIGNLVGAVFMAAHAAQGPKLGVPQMVQSRGQFGSYGALFVTVVVIMMYIGYTASNITIGGRSVHGEFGALPLTLCILGTSAISLGIAIAGHDAIHTSTRYLSIVSALMLCLCFVWVLFKQGLPANFMQMGGFSVHDFAGALSLAALWQLSYAPYVSDYSRYLPENMGASAAFWGTYLGVVAGSMFPMLLGAMMGEFTLGGDVIGALAHSLGGLSPFAICVFAFAVACCGALDLYGGMLAIVTLLQTFRSDWRPGTVVRVSFSVFILLMALVMSLSAQANFLQSFMNFLFLLLYVLVPWTAINLVDYYAIHHGDYDVASFFRRDGGIYGRWNWPALFCYAVGIVVQIPFIASTLYTGPFAQALGGADLSWIVGLLVVSPLYYAIARKGRRAAMAGRRDVEHVSGSVEAAR